VEGLSIHKWGPEITYVSVTQKACRHPRVWHQVTALASGWLPSCNRSEHPPDACSQRHGQRTPERDPYCAHRHSRAARACGQPA